MRKSRFNEEQILAALTEGESGTRIEDVCERLKISVATYYNWKKRYGGMQQTELKELWILLDENRKLKQEIEQLTVDRELLQDIIASRF